MRARVSTPASRDPAVVQPVPLPLRVRVESADPTKRVLEFIRPKGRIEAFCFAGELPNIRANRQVDLEPFNWAAFNPNEHTVKGAVVWTVNDRAAGAKRAFELVLLIRCKTSFS